MNLRLSRPLVFFDIESTGLDIATDRIVELCLIKVRPDGTEDERVYRFNPEKPISAEASAVNGISDEDVQGCPTFKERAAEIADYLKGCDLAGYNSNKFDVPLLVEDLLRADTDFDITKSHLVDVQTIFHKMEPRNLVAAYRFYCGKSLEDAHTALADTRATYEVLKAELEHYPDDVKNDVPWLEEFTRRARTADLAGRIGYNAQGQEVFNFGKYRGQVVSDVLRRDPNYYIWMMQGDFPLNTKQILTKIRVRGY